MSECAEIATTSPVLLPTRITVLYQCIKCAFTDLSGKEQHKKQAGVVRTLRDTRLVQMFSVFANVMLLT